MHRATKSLDTASKAFGWPLGLRSAANRVVLDEELAESKCKNRSRLEKHDSGLEPTRTWGQPYPLTEGRSCDSFSDNIRVQSQNGMSSKVCLEQKSSFTPASGSPRSSNGESDVSSVSSRDSPVKGSNVSTHQADGVIRPLGSLRSIVKGQPMGAWDTAWKEGITPWDTGAVTPFVRELIGTGLLSSMRVLVPGCGSGYDVLALASSAKEVVGLDISSTAIKRAIKLRDSCTNPRIHLAKFVTGNFFDYQPSQPFDLILDYTFFCALEPHLRKDWAQCVSRLLRPKGQLITIVYPISNHEGGPPYAVTPDAYKAVLEQVGFEATLLVPNLNSFPSRQGKEVVGHWRRRSLRADL